MAVINVDTSIVGRLTADEGKLLKMAEHFDKFIVDWQMKHPSVWRDRLPKGVFSLFQGLSQKTNVFRGTLGPQAGLSDWSAISGGSTKPVDQSNPGFDACTYNPQTYSWGVESFDFSGYKTSWRSPAFCVNDLKYVDKAKEQLGMIIRAGSQVTDAVKETFNREMYVKTAVDAGKGVIFAEGAMDFIDNANSRFSYNPFASPNVITFPTALLPNISTLNWTFLDHIRTYMADQCPDAALSSESGMPVFGLMLDIMDFERYVLEDADIREDFRYAIPQQLIKGFNMGFKVYRGFALIHDPRQMRFEVTAVGSTTTTATRVAPRRATRAGTIGYIPEANPDYITAELALGVIFLSDVIQVLVPPTITNFGEGMIFGPAPGFNGEWAWLNIKDPTENPLGEIGYFFSRYEYHVKPLQYASEAIVFLYRRCPHALGSGCAIETADDVAGDSESVSLAKNAVAADVDATNYTLRATLAKKLPGGVGDKVTCTDASAAVEAAWIADASQAPTYVFASNSAFTAYTEWTTSASVKMA